MAEHDLWNEEDFFEKLKKEKRAAETPQAEQQAPQEEAPASPLDSEPESLESDLFEKQEEAGEEQAPEDDIFFGAQDDEEQPTPPPEIAQDFEEEESPQIPALEEEEEEAPEEQEEYVEFGTSEAEETPAETPPKKYALSDNYEDEKLAPVNYKPVIIGALVVILIIVLFFVLRGLVFKGKGEKETTPATQPTTTQEKTTPQAQPENPLQAKQKQFFATLAGANAYNIGLIGAIQKSLSANNAQLTSLLLYNDELTFEIHCKNRDVLATVTVNLRNVPQFTNLKLISTNEWPGGAIDAVFHLKIAGGASAQTPGSKLADSAALQQWLTMLGQQFSVKISAFQQAGTFPAELGLKRVRVVFQAVGSYRGVSDFINALASANRNLKIHKLVLTALNQKNFSKSNYRVELTVDLFK